MKKTAVHSAFFRAAKAELRAAKKTGDKRAIKRLLDEAESVLDEVTESLPIRRPRR